MLLWLVICGALAFSGLMLSVFSDDSTSILAGLGMALLFGYLFCIEWIQQDNLRDQPRETCVEQGGSWVKEITVRDGDSVLRVATGACLFQEAVDA